MNPPDPERSPAWIIAHRGASRRCPGNTLAAFDEALRAGCDAIEFDVQLSRDGVPVVWHDRTLNRAGGGRTRVAQSTTTELRRLDAAARFPGGFARQPIPTLDGVLSRYSRRTRLLVEIKAREAPFWNLRLARAAADAVARHRASGSVLILSFDPAVLDELGSVAPRLRRVLNVEPPRSLPAALRRRMAELTALSANVRTLTRRFAAEVRRAGCPLLVYTCNTPQRVRTALDCGASGVMSDRPGWLRERLASAGEDR